LRAHDIYGMDARLNASIRYRGFRWGTLSVYCQNLLGYNENKRYAYDAGDIRLYSSRWQFVSEARTFGIRIEALL